MGTNLGINLEATYNFVNLEIQMGNCSNPTNFSTLMFPGRQEDMECRGNVFVCFYVGVVLVVGHQGYGVNVATYYCLCILLLLLHLLLLLLPSC